MELLDDVCHLESRVGPFGDIVSFSVGYIGAQFAPNAP